MYQVIWIGIDSIVFQLNCIQEYSIDNNFSEVMNSN